MILDHITAIVSDADRASQVLARLLGIPSSGRIQTAGMAIHTFRIGDAQLHVNAPTGPGAVRDHHDRHGPSLHHLALRVDDLDRALVDLAERGFGCQGAPIETAPGIREVFLDPATTAGLWIQLVERAPTPPGAAFDSAAIDALADSGHEHEPTPSHEPSP